MKRIIIISFISALFFYSCDSLDLAPIDNFASGNFWKNTSQVDGNMLSLHNDIRNQYKLLFFLGEVRGGTQVESMNSLGISVVYGSPFKMNTFTKDLTGYSNWAGYYGPILKVNNFINQVENGCEFLSTNDRGYFLGQAYGIRAYYYFMLYRTYGGVPIIDKPTVMDGVINASDFYVPRSTPKQTLDFIKSDVAKSDQYFASDFAVKSNSLWSKGATLMLKAEIFLWSAKVTDGDQTPSSSDIQTAKDALVQLTGKFSLLDKFSDIFEYDNKENNETIFGIRFIDGEASCSFMGEFIPRSWTFENLFYSKEGKLMADTLEVSSITTTMNNEYKFELFERYQIGDSRKDVTFLDFYRHDNNHQVIGKGLILRKFIGIINDNGIRSFVTDLPIFRYSEALLMMAELENKQGNDPSPYINQVRKRAYGAHYNPDIHAYSNSDFATNELAILYERDKEFVFEGKRWFDVRRMQDASGRPLVFSSAASYGTTEPILDYATEAYKVLWPIDVNTLADDPSIEQTPGY